MLLTISTTHEPATDLGYLLFKHPDRIQQFRQSFGAATVFYPEATEQRCTAALLLEVDPIRLARGRGKNSPEFALSQYVNDRPYAASSLLGAAMADVFSTARSGRCDAKPELAAAAIPLRIEIPAMPCRGGAGIAHRIFEPLGWTVVAEAVPLDQERPDWGDSRYVTLTLTGTQRLADALNQLYVLLPVLDESKHYWQGTDEVDKLLRVGTGWLASHPDRDLIANRYLGRRGGLARTALERLAELDDLLAVNDGDDDATESARRHLIPVSPAAGAAESAVAEPLHRARQRAVIATLAEVDARSVIDLGCGSGALLSELEAVSRLTRIVGVEVSAGALAGAARRLHLLDASERRTDRLQLFQGALTYRDDRFAGFDAAVLMEVIEHVDPPRLPALVDVVFGGARPGVVIVTTPNVEYNAHFPDPTALRHRDHRFEWTRAEFAEWADAVAAAHGYTVELRGIGPDDPGTGAPTQLGVFRCG